MPNVLIRDLDPTVHAALSARAERQGRSLQQYLSAELAKLAARPTFAEVFAEIEAQESGPGVPADVIVESIRRGRERTQ